MDRNPLTMSMHTTFLAAGIALWQLGISVPVMPGKLPAPAAVWLGGDQGVTCVVEDLSAEDYWSRYAALLIKTSGGDGTALAPDC